jgi:lipoate-protein ligase A
MIEKALHLFSPGTDPYQNLALEEYLLRRETPGEVHPLSLAEPPHRRGRPQPELPWRECRVEELEATAGFLARRLSGGGAVYHDLGNLNFTFLARGADYDLEKQLSVILRAVRALGADAEKDGRNDLTA